MPPPRHDALAAQVSHPPTAAGGHTGALAALSSALGRERRRVAQYDKRLADLLALGQLHRRTPQRTNTWFRARRGKLTASHFGAAAGMCAYASPRDLHRHLEATAALTPPLPGEDEESDAEGGAADAEALSEDVARGVRLEPLAVRAYAEALCSDVLETGLWTSSEHSFLGASPDGLVGDDGLVEVKAPRALRRASDGIKPTWMAQMQGQMAITRRAWCDLVEVSQGSGNPRAVRIRVTRVPFCPAYWAWLLARLKAFWGNLQAGLEQAQPDTSARTQARPMPPPTDCRVIIEAFAYSD